MSKILTVFMIGVVLLTLTMSVSAVGAEVKEATQVICRVLESLYTVLYLIAAGIGVVVLTLQGIKWASSADDPGARKQAKQGIIHVIVGLIIVLIAIQIVSLVFTGDKCAIVAP